MKTNDVKFVKAECSLTKRIWVEVDRDLSVNKTITQIKKIIGNPLESSALQIKMVLKEKDRKLEDCLIQLIKEIHSIKVGYEKSYPLISVFMPYTYADEDFISALQEVDLYRPGIQIFLSLTEEALAEGNDIDFLRVVAGEIYERERLCAKNYLDTNTVFLMEKDASRWNDFLLLSRLLYTYNTADDVKRPVIQISPKIEISEELKQKVLDYIRETPDIWSLLDIMCGFITLILKEKEFEKLKTHYVVLNSCGAGVYEFKIKNEQSAFCYYADYKEPYHQDFDCKSCDYVKGCTGCGILNIGDCYSRKWKKKACGVCI